MGRTRLETVKELIDIKREELAELIAEEQELKMARVKPVPDVNYHCDRCKWTFDRSFTHCPGCGVEIDWNTEWCPVPVEG